MLRVGVGLSGDFVIRPDELFQYLEQAHRWVFGYGQVHWEYRLGLRTWLLPAISALPLWLCKIVGFAHPDVYVPVVKIWHAALAMAIPLGMYLFGRRVLGEAAARIAFLFGCFWYEFIIFATHAVAEQYAASAFFAALALLSSSARTARLVAVGFLLGLVVVLRFAYLPVVGVFGLALLSAYQPRRWSVVFVGGLAALVLGGAVDYFSWGRWWHSIRLYFDLLVFNDFLYASVQQTSDPEFLFTNPMARILQIVWQTSAGLYWLALLAFFDFRRCWLLLLPIAVLCGTHLWAGSGVTPLEYNNLFILWPLLWMLLASLVARGVNFPLLRGRHLPKMFFAWAAAATVAGVVGGLPANYGERLHFYSENEGTQIARFLSRRPPDEVRAVLWLSGDIYYSGGYYYLHQRVPTFYPTAMLYHDEMVKMRMNSRAGDSRAGNNRASSPGGLNRLVSHIVASRDVIFPGFSRGMVFGDSAVFVTNSKPDESVAFEYFPTDMLVRGWVSMEAEARELGVFYYEPQMSWLSEDYDGPFCAVLPCGTAAKI